MLEHRCPAGKTRNNPYWDPIASPPFGSVKLLCGSFESIAVRNSQPPTPQMYGFSPECVFTPRVGNSVFSHSALLKISITLSTHNITTLCGIRRSWKRPASPRALVSRSHHHGLAFHLHETITCTKKNSLLELLCCLVFPWQVDGLPTSCKLLRSIEPPPTSAKLNGRVRKLNTNTNTLRGVQGGLDLSREIIWCFRDFQAKKWKYSHRLSMIL